MSEVILHENRRLLRAWHSLDRHRARTGPLECHGVTTEGLPEIAALAADLEAAGHALLDRDRLPAERRSLRLAADLRYRGQAFELMVPLDDGPLDAPALERLAERFHALHLQRFSFDDRDEGIELVCRCVSRRSV